jgi:hypothetical protein
MSGCRRLLLGSLLLVAISLSSVQPVRAESGHYMSDDGPWCYFRTVGAASTMICVGYSQVAGGLVLFSCDYHTNSAIWVDWTCTDNFGNRWGSRR